jgi:3-hydroxy-9,10-secoandrosta-1,3,5(10)-triene-9,17-dione monooxygenase
MAPSNASDGHSSIRVPESDLTPEEFVKRAHDLKPTLRSQQDESDVRGTYSQELHDTFRKAGFYRALQPRMFGGYEFDLPTFYSAMLEISHGHPAVGWGLTLASCHALTVASHWPEAAQREFFGPNGDFMAPHRGIPMGTCVPVEGGYRVTGVWSYCSGIPYATHLIAHTLLKVDGKPPAVVVVVLPRAALTVLDDWGGDLTLGMRASGSNSVRITDAFVPAHHLVSLVFHGIRSEDMAEGTPGTRLHNNPMYLGRIIGPYQANLVVPIIGAARAALDEFEETIKAQKSFYDPMLPRADDAGIQLVFGEALARATAAEAILLQGAHRYMELCNRWAERGHLISIEDNLRLVSLFQQAGDLACDAVEGLFRSSGSFATRKGHRMVRYFGDVTMYRTHILSQTRHWARALARAPRQASGRWRAVKWLQLPLL